MVEVFKASDRAMKNSGNTIEVFKATEKASGFDEYEKKRKERAEERQKALEARNKFQQWQDIGERVSVKQKADTFVNNYLENVGTQNKTTETSSVIPAKNYVDPNSVIDSLGAEYEKKYKSNSDYTAKAKEGKAANPNINETLSFLKTYTNLKNNVTSGGETARKALIEFENKYGISVDNKSGQSSPLPKNKVQFYKDYKEYLENGGEEIINLASAGASDSYWIKSSIGLGQTNHWDYINDGEMQMYNYLFSTQGEAAADEFLQTIQNALDKRAYEDDTAKQVEKYENASALEKVGMNAQSVAQNVLGAPMAFTQDVFDYLTTGQIRPYSDAHGHINSAATTRELTAEDLTENIDNEFLKTLASNTYQSAMSGADSLLGFVTFGKGYSFTMGMGAASSKARELYEKGASETEIIIGSLVSGAIEVITEKLSLDKFVDNTKAINSFKTLLKKVLEQGGVEASEEIFSEIGNIAIDSIIEGSAPDIKESISDIFWAAYGGFVSGGGMQMVGGLPSATVGTISTHQTANDIIKLGNGNNLVDIALTLPEESKAYKQATELSGKDSFSASKIGELYWQTSKDIKNAVSSNIKQSVQTRLAQSGVTNAGELAQIITDMSAMEEVSSKNQAKVYGNAVARQIYTELTHSESSSSSEWLQELSEQNKQLFQNMNLVNLSKSVGSGYLTKVRQILNGETSELQSSANATQQNNTAEDGEISVLESSENASINDVVGEKLNSIKNTAEGENISTDTLSVPAVDTEENAAQDGRTENRSVLREPAEKEIYRPLTSQEIMNAAFGRGKNVRQRQVEAVAKKFGLTVYWSDQYSRGVYDPKTRTIRMNPSLTITQAYITVFKHEFTHYLEDFSGYKGFKDYLFKHSKAFEEYVRGALEKKNGEVFEGTREEALRAYTDIVMKERKTSKEISIQTRNSYTTEKIEREIVADFVGDVLLFGENAQKSEEALLEIAETDRNIFQKIMDWIKDLISLVKGEPQNRTLEEDLQYLNQRLARVYDSAQKNTAKNSGEKYSLNINAKSELHKALYDISYRSEVLLRDDTPSIMLSQNGVKNRQMVMNASHIRENVFTEDEARKLGLKVDEHTHYHGLGEDYFLKIIDSLDNVKEAYRGTKNASDSSRRENYFLLVTEFKDESGNVINVPVFIDELAQCNRVFIESNKIATVFGREGFRDYINRQVREKNLVRIKNRSNKISEGDALIAPAYENIAPVDSIPNPDENVNGNFSVASEEFTAEMEKLTSQLKEGKISVDDYAAKVTELADGERKASAELRESMAKMEEKHASELIDNYRYMAQQKKRIHRQNEQLKQRRSEISKKITEQREERASKQKNIEHIRKVVSRIDKSLRTNSDSKHVPEDFKAAAGQFVRIFLENDTSPFDKKDLQQLRTVYFELLGEDFLSDEAATEEISGFDIEIMSNLRMLANRLDGKTLRELNYSDTLLIRDIVDNFAHIINEQNEMFVNDKKAKTTEIGNAALQEVSMGKTKRDNALIRAFDKNIKYSNMTPIYFFDRMGETFKTLFNDVLNGQDKWYRNIENSKTYISQVKEKYNYSKWSDETLELTTEYGDKIKITREQALLLYATAKREYGNKVQMSEHLFRGGIVVERVDKSLKDAIKDINKNKGKVTEKIVRAFTDEVDSRAHKITPNDVSEVFAWLTEEQRSYADAMVEYLSKDMAALGNETSMQLVGINKFNEDYYIPYNSAQNFLYSQPGVTNEARLKHQSFTKNTQRGARTPLVLSNFSEVCADHINRMCMYNALTVPLENMNKIFNYKSTSTKDVTSKSVRAEIERVYGADATAYIKQFIEDMNGNVRVSNEDKAINRWIGKFKKGAVFASASVVIQQPSAIMRAMALVDAKYFAKTTLKLSERDYQQAVKYAAVAGIKEMGRFDTGTGVATTQWLLQENPTGIKNKVKAFFDTKDSNYRDDKFSYFAAKADEITWAHIWAAVKAEIADTTDLKVGSEEYFEKCGERFTEVIDYTQVYDSTLSRSQIMRSKSTGAQMLTAFMSEPTVSLNLLMKAYHEGKSGTKEGVRFAGRAVGAFVGNVILNAMLKSLVTAARDDDEDKTYLEKYIGKFVENVTSDLFLLNMIPFVKDIISIFLGYPVERADMSLFSDLKESIDNLDSKNKTVFEKIESISGSLAAFLGLPVKNVLRDVRAAYNLAMDFFVNDNKTSSMGIKYEVLESLGFDSKDSDKYEELMHAAENDDEEKYQELYKYLTQKGKKDSQIWSGVKKAYGESKDVEERTKDIMLELKENKTFESFSAEDKEKLEDNIKSSFATQKAVDSVISKNEKFDALYDAFRKNKNKYAELKKNLANEGLTEKQIADGLEYARLAYMQKNGVDLKEYLLFKMATSKTYADTDGSGGVSKVEKIKAINEMDIDKKVKEYLKYQHK